jgi:hypothetical protein
MARTTTIATIHHRDRSLKTITILDQSFSLADVNVILGGDGPRGSQLVRALQIDPRFPAEPMHFELAVRRSPQLLS